MYSITDFINDELLPRVLDNMDTVFPKRKWTLKGKRWSSPFHTDGTASQSGARERSYIKTDSRYRFRVGETDDGQSMGLIDYALIYYGHQAGAKGDALISTLKELCSKVNLELPSLNSEEYEKFKAHQERVEQLYKQMVKALFNEEGKEVLAYLTDVRGYSVELIKKMGLGFISQAMADTINKEKLPLSYNPSAVADIEKGVKNSIPYGVGRTHQLVVPYISNGHIRGFKFRLVKPHNNKDGKPLDKYYNNLGLPKAMYLFGFKGFHLTGDKVKDLDMTIVEGELDALHAQAMGLENVVAAAGGSFSDKVIEEAKKKGVVRVTLLFDTEESEEKQESTYVKVDNAIKKIRGGGLTAFYATF